LILEENLHACGQNFHQEVGSVNNMYGIMSEILST